MEYYKRIVVGRNSEGKSAVLTTTSNNGQSEPNQYYRATLCSTSEAPADNSIEGDRGANRIDRVPPKNGSHIRVLEMYPEDPDRKKFWLRPRQPTRSSVRSTNQQQGIWPGIL